MPMGHISWHLFQTEYQQTLILRPATFRFQKISKFTTKLSFPIWERCGPSFNKYTYSVIKLENPSEMSCVKVYSKLAMWIWKRILVNSSMYFTIVLLSRTGFLIYLNKCKSPFLCKALCQVRMNYAERFYSKRSITKTRDDIIKQVISFQQKSYTLTKAIYSNLHVVESLPGKTCVACLLLFF